MKTPDYEILSNEVAFIKKQAYMWRKNNMGKYVG